MIENATKLAYLKDEYFLLQKFYEDFDARVITIKGWSATVSLAALGLGFQHTRYLWLFASAAALVFWALEAMWKGFQYMYVPRICFIEEVFGSAKPRSIEPLQIYAAWDAEFQANGLRWWRNLFLPLVMFPHAVTFVAGIALFFLNAIGIIAVPGR